MPLPALHDFTERQHRRRNVRNVLNETDVTALVATLITDHVANVEGDHARSVEAWLRGAARQHALKRGPAAPVTHLPPNAPAWAHDAHRAGTLVSVDVGSYRTEWMGLIDYLLAHPQRQLNKVAYDDVVANSRAWHQQLMQQKTMDEDWNGITVVMDVPGTDQRWVKVTSPQALAREGAFMRHCVGSYAQRVADGGAVVFSLRNADNRPLLTVEAVPVVDDSHRQPKQKTTPDTDAGSERSWKITQIRGVCNAIVGAEHAPALNALVQRSSKHLDRIVDVDEIESSGFVFDTKKRRLVSFEELPDGYTIDHPVRLIGRIPRLFHLKFKKLIIEGADVSALTFLLADEVTLDRIRGTLNLRVEPTGTMARHGTVHWWLPSNPYELRMAVARVDAPHHRVNITAISAYTIVGESPTGPAPWTSRVYKQAQTLSQPCAPMQLAVTGQRLNVTEWSGASLYFQATGNSPLPCLSLMGSRVDDVRIEASSLASHTNIIFSSVVNRLTWGDAAPNDPLPLGERPVSPFFVLGSRIAQAVPSSPVLDWVVLHSTVEGQPWHRMEPSPAALDTHHDVLLQLRRYATRSRLDLMSHPDSAADLLAYPPARVPEGSVRNLLLETCSSGASHNVTRAMMHPDTPNLVQGNVSLFNAWHLTEEWARIGAERLQFLDQARTWYEQAEHGQALSEAQRHAVACVVPFSATTMGKDVWPQKMQPFVASDLVQRMKDWINQELQPDPSYSLGKSTTPILFRNQDVLQLLADIVNQEEFQRWATLPLNDVLDRWAQQTTAAFAAAPFINDVSPFTKSLMKLMNRWWVSTTPHAWLSLCDAMVTTLRNDDRCQRRLNETSINVERFWNVLNHETNRPELLWATAVVYSRLAPDAWIVPQWTIDETYVPALNIQHLHQRSLMAVHLVGRLNMIAHHTLPVPELAAWVLDELRDDDDNDEQHRLSVERTQRWCTWNHDPMAWERWCHHDGQRLDAKMLADLQHQAQEPTWNDIPLSTLRAFSTSMHEHGLPTLGFNLALNERAERATTLATLEKPQPVRSTLP